MRAASFDAPLFFALMADAFAASGQSFAELGRVASAKLSLLLARRATAFRVLGLVQHACEPRETGDTSVALTSPLLHPNKHPPAIHSDTPIAITNRATLAVRAGGFIT
jgi:hypothetical protein